MPGSSAPSKRQRFQTVSDSWTTVAVFEPKDDEQLEQLANAFLKVLKFLNSKRLLLIGGKKKLACRTRAQASRLGLFRRDVTALGARFLDSCASWWLADQIIFESLMPSIGHPYGLVSQWEKWTNERDENFKKQFRKLLKGDNDFDLCDLVYKMLDSSPNLFMNRKSKWDELQIVRFVWGAMGIIDNGGFEYFFAGSLDEDPDLTRTKKAFEAIGCKPAMKAFERAFSCFKGGRPTRSASGRSCLFKKLSEKTRQSINRQFWKSGRDGLISKLLAEYIRTHHDTFEVEPP